MFASLCALYTSFSYALGTSIYAPVSQRYSWAAISIIRASFSLPFFLIWAATYEFSSSNGAGGFADLTWPALAWLVLASIGTQGCADGLLLVASRKVGVPTSLTIAGIYPLWMALWGLIHGEQIVPRQWLGLSFVLAGVSYLVYTTSVKLESPTSDLTKNQRPSNTSAHFLSFEKLQGIALSLLTSLLFALAVYAISSGGKGINIGVANSVRMSLALVIAPIFAVSSGVPLSKIVLPFREVKALVWVLMLETVGFAAYVFAMVHGSLLTVSALSSLAPVVAIVIAWIMRKEAFSLARVSLVLMTCVGAVLLL